MALGDKVRLMTPLPARVVQVLKDFLPAELDLIDAEEADAITTPDIPNANYFEWDQRVIRDFPACSLNVISSRPNAEEVSEIRPDQFGRRASARHRIDVQFHVVRTTTSGDPLLIQRYLTRYIAGAMRVLTIMKYDLQTSGDPNPVAHRTDWIEEATYGPEDEQEGGSIARTAILPIEIWTIEARG